MQQDPKEQLRALAYRTAGAPAVAAAAVATAAAAAKATAPTENFDAVESHSKSHLDEASPEREQYVR